MEIGVTVHLWMLIPAALVAYSVVFFCKPGSGTWGDGIDGLFGMALLLMAALFVLGHYL
jgi:hypothetical protein